MTAGTSDTCSSIRPAPKAEQYFLVMAGLMGVLASRNPSWVHLGATAWFLSGAVAARIRSLGGNPDRRGSQRRRIAMLVGVPCVALAALTWISKQPSRMDIGLHVIDWDVEDWKGIIADNRQPDTPQQLVVPSSWWRFSFGAPPTVRGSDGTQRPLKAHGLYPFTVYNPYEVTTADDQEFLGVQLQRALREELGVEATLEQVRRDFSQGLSSHTYPIWRDSTIVRELERRQVLPLGQGRVYVAVLQVVYLFLGFMILDLRYRRTLRHWLTVLVPKAPLIRRVGKPLAIAAIFGLVLWVVLSVPSRSIALNRPPIFAPFLGTAQRLAERFPVAFWLVAMAGLLGLGRYTWRAFAERWDSSAEELANSSP